MSDLTSTSDSVPSQPFRQHPMAVFALAVMAAIVLWATLKILAPFLTPLVLALIIVTFTFPIYRWLRSRLKGRSALAAMIMLLGITLVLFLPAVGLIVLLVDQATQLVAVLQKIDVPALKAQLDLDGRLAFLTRFIPGFRPEAIGLDGVLLSIIRGVPTFIANYGGMILGQFAGVVIGFFMMLLAAFYFYTQGESTIRRLKFLSPLPDEYDDEIIDKFRGVVDATFRGQVLTAIAQGVVTGVGLAIAQVPAPALWGAVAAVFALIPMVGAAAVWVPAAGYLFLIASMGHIGYGYGIFLVVWGVGVVSLVDNFIRPWAMKSGMNMHAIVLFFSIIGGIAAFGVVGMVIGPLVFALLVTVISIYSDFFQKPLDAQNEGMEPKKE